MLKSVIDILNYITISQLLIFCIFFIVQKKGNRLSNKLLAFLFLCYALNLYTYFTDSYSLAFYLKHAPRVIWFFEPFSFCISPLLYLHTMSLVKSNFKLSSKHILFFLPFLVYVYLTITNVTIQHPETIQKLVTQGYFLSLPTYFILYTILRLSNLLLATLALFELFRYKKELNTANQTPARFDVNWQLIILLGFSVVFIFEGMNYVYFYFINKFQFLILWDAVPFVKFFIINTLIFTGLKNSLLVEANEIRTKYSKSQLVNDEKEILLENLRAFMTKEKYYLTPSITLQDVADKMNEQPRYISQVINEILGQNVIDFINSYRIEEAKKMLVDPKYNQYSILGILFESGFNSKTAFNNAFKKQTGHTPKEYRMLYERKD